MRLPITIAQKLISLKNGEKLPFSKLRHAAIDEMIDNGILMKLLQGRSKVQLYLPDYNLLAAYLKNHFGISDLLRYVETYSKEDLTRSEAIEIASNSKFKPIRTFKGFVVNCFEPLVCELNGKQITIQPEIGTFSFIYDFESFFPSDSITIVGVENPENFRFINKQRELFKEIKPLFVSRYPQSNDLIKWLQSISNEYLHFGDFDFAGINIYWNEYKKFLGRKAKFYVPSNIESLFRYGNRDLFSKQDLNVSRDLIEEDSLLHLINLIEKMKMGLEQEILLQ
jgi:hypothetical protein